MKIKIIRFSGSHQKIWAFRVLDLRAAATGFRASLKSSVVAHYAAGEEIERQVGSAAGEKSHF